MPRTIAQVLVALLIASASAAANDAQEPPLPAAERYEALLRKHQEASSGNASSADERMKLIARAFQRRHELALQFLELAEQEPDSPVALDALIQAVWQVNTTPWPLEVAGEDRARARAFELLRRHHLRSDRLGPLCQRVSFGFCREYESFLRAVLDENPHEPVQALAGLALAHFLKNRLQRLDLIDEQPRLGREFEELFGRDYLEESRRDRARAAKEAETLFERAAEEHGDAKLPDGGTVGGQARAELFEIRRLRVGAAAPDIEGVDQDGNRFKLSDYRGKVVLLDFWHRQ
jgi:hypothetical protein